MTITVICAVLTITATTGLIAAPILAITTSGAGFLSPLLTTLTNKTFIAKHRNNVREKKRKTKEILDKLYLTFTKANSDGVITQEEMKQIEKVLSATQVTPGSRSQTATQPFLDEELLRQILEALQKYSR